MLDQQFERALKKLQRMEQTYDGLIFAKVAQAPVSLYETYEHLRYPPQGVSYRPIAPGETWGGSRVTGWFRGKVAIDEALAGKKLYLRASTGALETMLFINGIPKGVYTNKIVVNSRGNHHTLYLTGGERAGAELDIALEGYCWHTDQGTQPFEEMRRFDAPVEFKGVEIMQMREEVKNFVIELRILNQLSENLPDDFRRAQVQNALMDVYRLVPQMPWECEEAYWLTRVHEARAFMAAPLAAQNPQSAPYAGLIGHSHMDTAWLWTIAETVRKCARTYANALSLLEQYPEYIFFQSSAYHGEIMRREYPAIFEGIKKQVAAGRYEPNGGVWIECDCNIVSGESLVRQFLWGQNWTKEHFGYLSDTFWLPDTFGYSAAIPQIMKGCGISYFLTTKMSWNDTNTFPHDTFLWRGADGTEVLTQFNEIHFAPDAAALIGKIVGYDRPGSRPIRHKRVNNSRMLSYGFGDGGGGPSYDMIEVALRLGDVEGVPKAKHTTVSAFMRHLEQTSRELPVYSGELYLELHRGTLTGKAQIKRNNRKGEIALRDLELANAIALLDRRALADVRPLMETLLVNQFHDILPGTSIAPVNDESIDEMKGMIAAADADFTVQMGAPDAESLALVNTLSWERTWAYLPAGQKPSRAISQTVTAVDGEEKLYVEGIRLPSLSSSAFAAAPADDGGSSPFSYDGATLHTPCVTAVFDKTGGIASLVDKASGRQLRKAGGYPLNTFLFGEDIPLGWDNWDIDEDVIENIRPGARLTERSVVSDGPLQIRLRSRYNLGDASAIVQDMVFYANTPRVDFETLIDWKEKHKLLKASFDLDILADEARHEIQFGYATRNTYKRNSYEQAMFEVSNHKYTDLSETRFGVAILNDCKYGISLSGTCAGLSLMKSGTHPDARADQGRHLVTYSLLPHGPFSAESVTRPAYELNMPVRVAAVARESLLSIGAPNVIVEAVKVAEDGDGVIARLYECEKSGVSTALNVGFPHAEVWETNLIEEPIAKLTPVDGAYPLTLRAFEIKTVRVRV